MTQSADLPVRPFGAEPAEPASAVEAPPDASGAAPAKMLPALSALLLLCVAAPSAAGGAAPARNQRDCPHKHGQPAAAAAIGKPAISRNTTVSSGAGGGRSAFVNWGRIAADLMP